MSSVNAGRTNDHANTKSRGEALPIRFAKARRRALEPFMHRRSAKCGQRDDPNTVIAIIRDGLCSRCVVALWTGADESEEVKAHRGGVVGGRSNLVSIVAPLKCDFPVNKTQLAPKISHLCKLNFWQISHLLFADGAASGLYPPRQCQSKRRNQKNMGNGLLSFFFSPKVNGEKIARGLSGLMLAGGR